METLEISGGTLKQSIFDKIGNGNQYQRVLFTDGSYYVDTPIKLNDGSIITFEKNALLTLKDNVDPDLFKPMVPIFGQKKSTISDITFEDVNFFGNKDNQERTPPGSPHGDNAPQRWGNGYHNLIGLTNGSNIVIEGTRLKYTLGDGARLTNCNKVKYYNNNIIECGHDGLYVDGGSDIEAYNNYTELRVNSAIRFRHVSNGRAYNNEIYNKVGSAASSPGIQIEISTSGAVSNNIVIENNYIAGTQGPGIWVIGTANPSTTAAQNLLIQKNTFFDCGNIRGQYGTGGIVADGWTKLKIIENEFKSCKGYGVLFGSYVSAASSGKGYTAEVLNNYFEKIRPSYWQGTASGTAIANLIPNKYTVAAIGNRFYDNTKNYYNVVGQEDRTGKPCQVFITCTEDQIPAIKKAAGNNPIYRRK
jgi:hypothetical protein